jgi:hypothetical protein
MACWGAQAASLSFLAACRKFLGTFNCTPCYDPRDVVGRLPTTAGWQPALPRGVLPETKDLAGPDELAYVQGLTSYVVGI